jgi:hypothetical protein
VLTKTFANPSTVRLDRAGAHLILAHSPDEYVFHAKEALRLYELMYTDLPQMVEPTEKQLTDKAHFVAEAQRVLQKTEEDEAFYNDGEDLDDAAVDAFIEKTHAQCVD